MDHLYKNLCDCIPVRFIGPFPSLVFLSYAEVLTKLRRKKVMSSSHLSKMERDHHQGKKREERMDRL